jgi:6-phosphogluconate dehydrogenase
MKLAMVGLGRMGGNMALRLLEGGHTVVVYDRNPDVRSALGAKGGTPIDALAGVVDALSPPRVVWLMLPAGQVTADAVRTLEGVLSPGDIIVDGGNSNYKDFMVDAARLAGEGLHYIDAGTSGGIWGLTEGYCLMVGGPDEAVKVAEPAFLTLAPPGGYAHVGPAGSGHFVKMVHNGIEYGLMQAYAEGFELMKSVDEFALDLHQIASIWRYGSVIRSWLLDLTERALADDVTLSTIRGYVDDTGEGRWTVQEAVDRAVPLPVITAALYARFSSREPDAYQAKLLAAMRNQFGGHAIHAEEPVGQAGAGPAVAGHEPHGSAPPST